MGVCGWWFVVYFFVGRRLVFFLGYVFECWVELEFYGLGVFIIDSFGWVRVGRERIR